MVKSYIDSKKSKSLIDKNLKDNAIFSKKDIASIISDNEILLRYIKEKIKLSDKEISGILEKEKEIFLPISIFKNKLSTLETIVKYLKEIKKLSFAEISNLLNRDQRTIWHAYNRTIKKHIEIKVLDSKITIPVSVFSDRKYSPLESLASYLREYHRFRFSKIAELLNLNTKTVWTVYARYKKKR